MQRLRRVELLIVAVLSATTAAAAALGAWRAPGAGSLPPGLDGPCSVEARIEPGGIVVDPATSAGVYVLPVEGTVRYRASIGDPATEGPRPLQGRVTVDLPAPLPDPVIARWDGTGTLASDEGTADYRLGRWWAPGGATIVVRAEHHEPGRVCSGTLTVRLAGTGFAVRSLLVTLLVASAALTARSVRPSRASRGVGPWDPPPAAGRRLRLVPAGRPGLGLVSGALHGVVASCLTLLAGAFDLASPWLFAGPVLGAAAGAALGWWAPGRAGADPASDAGAGDDGSELHLVHLP